MALSNQHICTGSTEPFLCHTAISTKIKCAGLFHYFKPNLTFFRYKGMITIWISIKFTICGQNYYN